MTRPGHQFSLPQFFLAVSIAAVFFASIAWAGPWGVIVFSGAAASALIYLGAVRGSWLYFVSGSALIVVVIGLTIAGSYVAIGDGWHQLPLAVRVLNAAGGPVAGATVRFREIDLERPTPFSIDDPIPANEPGMTAGSDSQGKATLKWSFPFTERVGLFVDEAHVYVSPYFFVQVDAPGYQRQIVELRKQWGGSFDWNKLPLPTVTVVMQESAEK